MFTPAEGVDGDNVGENVDVDVDVVKMNVVRWM